MLFTVILCFTLIEQYRHKHRLYTFWWAIAFLVTAGAALTQLLALTLGHWPEGLFRLYLVLAAAIPALMGIGSMYLLAPRRWATLYALFIGLLGGFAVYAAVSAELSSSALARPLQASTMVATVTSSPLVAMSFALLGALGAGALILVASISSLRTRRLGPLLILLGAVAYSLGNTLAARGLSALFFPSELLGILLLYGGVVASRNMAGPR